MTQAWEVILKTNQFWLNLYGLAGVSRLSMAALDDATKYFITNRPDTAGDPAEIQTAKWLNLCLCVDYPTVIVAERKGPIIAALDLDYYIDDKPENCMDAAGYRPQCKTFLQDASHNKWFDDPRITRIPSFDSFVREVLINGK